MEVKNISPRCFHITLGQTESNFLNELAFTADREPEKVLADLTFVILIERHAQMKLDAMILEHEVYWDH